MRVYTASVDVGAGVERTFAIFIDAARYPQWQGMALRTLDLAGPLDLPGSSVRIDHGPGMKLTMTILESEPPRFLRFRVQGMGTEATCDASFESIGGGTRVATTWSFRLPGGAVMRFLERFDRKRSQRELDAELARFALVAARPLVEVPSAGTVVSVDCGAGFRVATILEPDGDVVHVTLHPGVAKSRQDDPAPFLREPGSIRDPLAHRPVAPPARRPKDHVLPGQPALRLDGGAGVRHLALTVEAYGDALPELLGHHVQVPEEVLVEIANWRIAGGALIGRDVDASVTPMVSIRADDAFAIAKVLDTGIRGVHVRIYADRWPTRPDAVDPWALRLGTAHDPVVGVGHVPLSRSAFADLDPRFVRLAMLGPDELDGYREWKRAAGGYFG